MLKTNETDLIDESADVCLHLSGHVTSPAFGRVLSFVGIRSACTSFSPFTLVHISIYGYDGVGQQLREVVRQAIISTGYNYQ